MTDINPTIAALLRIQLPNGCIGKVVNSKMFNNEYSTFGAKLNQLGSNCVIGANQNINVIQGRFFVSF